MAKFFCPKCRHLTFALRYMTNNSWNKIDLQWCKVCKTTRKVNDCIEGLEGLAKINRG